MIAFALLEFHQTRISFSVNSHSLSLHNKTKTHKKKEKKSKSIVTIYLFIVYKQLLTVTVKSRENKQKTLHFKDSAFLVFHCLGPERNLKDKFTI